MTAITSLPSLHDWSLIRIELDWETSVITFHLRDQNGPRTLCGSAITELVVPNMAPWGRSRSINAIEEAVTHVANGRSLKIEMQSGDVITVIAGSIDLD